jgi:hypothetical protein
VPADQELQQWQRISRHIGADDRAVETERPNLLYVPHIAESTTPADLNHGERLHAKTDLNRGARLHTERIRSTLSLSARRPPSNNESSDDEDIFASDDEHDRWRDPDHRLTVDELYIGGARPVNLTTSDDRAHHTCSVCLQVKSHPVMYVSILCCQDYLDILTDLPCTRCQCGHSYCYVCIRM